MRQQGFTLIEIMVVFVIICTVMLLAFGGISSINSGSNVSIGINGMTESRCIEGYKFIVGQDGNARQILDEFGKGARCEIKSKPGNF
jgi:prepilin-type N-terminal cleavage/methylation domain-containing protein